MAHQLHKLTAPDDTPPATLHSLDDGYTFSDGDVARLRAALVSDVRADGGWTDADIRAMARSTLDLVRTLLDVAHAQRSRGLD